MHHTRPYRIFTLVGAPPSERAANVQIPPRRAAGGVTLLETFVMVAALRIVAARRVFEFGTYLGSTTLNLALNVPEGGEVFTLDLNDEQAAAATQHPTDIEFTYAHVACRALDFVGSPVEDRVKVLSGDSTRFDFSAWADSIDLSFIDGGHDVPTARSDTENALRMARKERPSCIVWHDYLNRDYPALTECLEQLSRQLNIFHVEDTMMCVWFNDAGGSIEARLKAEI